MTVLMHCIASNCIRRWFFLIPNVFFLFERSFVSLFSNNSVFTGWSSDLVHWKIIQNCAFGNVFGRICLFVNLKHIFPPQMKLFFSMYFYDLFQITSLLCFRNSSEMEKNTLFLSLSHKHNTDRIIHATIDIFIIHKPISKNKSMIRIRLSLSLWTAQSTALLITQRPTLKWIPNVLRFEN